MAGKSLIGALRVFLGIDSAELTKGTKEAENTVKEFVEKTKKHLEHLVEAFAVKELAEGFLKIDEHLDMLGKSAQKIGIPVEELSKLEYAAKLADVPFDELQSSVEKFNKGISQAAATAKGPVAAALKNMGISVRDVNGNLKPTSTLLGEVADSFSKHADGANKGALSMGLFGKAGAGMIAWLNQGSKGIKDAGDQLDQFGGVATPKAVEAAEKLIDDLKRMWQGFYSIAQQVVVYVTPSITTLTGKIVDFLGKAGGAKVIAAVIVRAMETIAIATVEVTGEISKSAAEIIKWVGSIDSLFARFDAANEYWIEFQKKSAVSAHDLGNQMRYFLGVTSQASNSTEKGDLAIQGLGDKLETTGQQADKAKAKLKAFFDELLNSKSNANDRDHLGGSANSEGPKKPDFAPYSALATKATKQHKDAINELIASLKFQNEELGKSALQMKIDSELQKLDIKDTDVRKQKIIDLTIALEKHRVEQQTAMQLMANDLERQAKAADFLKGKFQSWFDSAISGTFNLKSALADLAKSIATMGFQNLLGGLFAGSGNPMQGSPGGGFLSGLGKILGFATGGTIMPGGSGGVDSQLVAFRKSPDERVDITRPGQMLTSGGGTAVHFNIDARGADPGQITLLRVQLNKMAADMTKNVRAIVSSEKSANPSFAR